MATCKDCIHYDICIFHLKGNENEECVQFINTADVEPRNEVARDVFGDVWDLITNHLVRYGKLTISFLEEFAALKKKYTEDRKE